MEKELNNQQVGDKRPTVEEQLKDLQQGRTESDTKLSEMQDSLSCLAFLQPQAPTQASLSVPAPEIPVNQQDLAQSVQPQGQENSQVQQQCPPIASITAPCNTSGTVTSQTATLTSQTQRTAILPPYPVTWCSTRTTIPMTE